MRKIDVFYFGSAVVLSVSITSCAGPDPPPFAPGSPADPQVRSSSKLPRLVVRDQTTQEVEKALSTTEEEVKSAQSMHHDMQNMPGMKQDETQHGGHAEMQHGASEPSDKKKMAEEMKKTSDEMKATSDAMKRKSDELKTEGAIYTCPMHPQVRADKPGKCPICGMTLVKKKEGQ